MIALNLDTFLGLVYPSAMKYTLYQWAEEFPMWDDAILYLSLLFSILCYSIDGAFTGWVYD